MTTEFIRHHVEDFARWKDHFDADKEARTAAGCIAERIFRDVDDPNAVTVLLEWTSPDAAKAFTNDPRLAQAMKDAGVQGPPEVVAFMDPAGDLLLA